MEPISITVITYVSLKFIDQFIKEEGYSRMRKFFFRPKKYSNRITQIIYATIDEFETAKPFESINKKFPFYHSQLLFTELNKSILFDNIHPDYNYIIETFKTNTNIIIPELNELQLFYKIFTSKINNDTTLKKLFIEENYKDKIFQIGQHLRLIEKKIDDISSQVQDIYSENIFQPNKNWFITQCKASIHDLGKRYTPQLNLELEASQIFEGLGRTEEFTRKITNSLDELLIKGRKVLKKQEEIKENIEDLENHLNKLYTLFKNTNFKGVNLIPIEEFEKILNDIQNSNKEIYNHYITEETALQKKKNDYQFYHKYGYELKNIRELNYQISSFKELIQGPSFRLANNPFLILDGEAGIGKSHLIGDVVSKRIDKNLESVFLLGQHFVTEEDPWTQIFKRLQIYSKSEDFLKKLNNYAENTNKRIILFIDAINEGKGIYFWNNFIRSFINEIKNYRWLGLVLTIRTSYKNLIFPKEERESINIIEYQHYGFRNIEYEASKLFFDNYRIELPNVPLLHPEFQNPLFLKLFCEGINKAGLTRIPDGLQGITSIINFFIDNVNNILSKPTRTGFSSSLNLVKKSIYALVKHKVDNQFRYVPYELAYQVIDESISTFVNKRGFIDELIIEGVLSKNLFWVNENTYEEGVYLSYERFEDHITVQYLLERNPELDKEFNEGGQLYNYVKNEHSIYIHKGLIEAFSIQIPERNGFEFNSLIPKLKEKYPVVESFIESLLWRKINTITEESKKYVDEYVFYYQDTYNLFWETIIAVTGIPNHYFNAHFIHKQLASLTLEERDATWTQFLKYKYDNSSSVKRLIDWAWNGTDKSHISDESILLSSITLGWFHTSTNRKLRDCSTKALICLLHDRLNLVLELLKYFAGVNDVYVYERLFAVAYGCVLRNKDKKKISELSEYIFEIIFNNTYAVFPHILLRDYARGIIEYANYIDVELSFELSKIRPPYHSTWPDKIATYDELKDKYDNDDYMHLWISIMGFGDFARYTIGTNSGFSEWSSYKRGETIINREQIFVNFKNKLNSDQLSLLNYFDSIINESSFESILLDDTITTSNTTLEQEFEEKLEQARDSFKKLLSTELLLEYEKEIEPFISHNNKLLNKREYFDLGIAQRLILSRVIELGWKPKLHLLFDNEIGTGRGRDDKYQERIGKKYQWIAYYEYLALLSDNFVKQEKWGDGKEKIYQGPWDPYVRDIDPTILISKTGNNDDNDDQLQKFWWTDNETFDWDCTNEYWINNQSDLPNIHNILQVVDNDGEEWLVLEGYPSWSEPKKIGEEKWNQPRKTFWCQLRSYLVKDDEFSILRDWAVNQDFMGRWMPESGTIYEMFSREYYWSPAQDYFTKEYYDGNQWTEVHDKKSRKYIAKVNISAQSFLWEEEFDKSKEETIRFLKPSKLIFDGMNFKYSQNEGEFINNLNEVQCFAPDVYHNSKSYLLIKKHSFNEFLLENNLKIIWTVLGEKQVIGGRTFNNDFSGRLEISGAYYFENGNLVGNINTKHS